MIDYDELNEADLVRLAQQGDRYAFEPIVVRNKDRVFGMIHRSTRDFHLSEELSQEVFVRAYRGILHFRFDCSISSWLIRITLNVVATYWGSRPYRQSQLTGSIDDDLHDTHTIRGDEVVLHRERVSMFYHCLDDLRDRFKTAIVLVGLQGASYAEAAEAMQVPVGTVRSRLNHARILLSKCLALRGDLI